MDKHSKNPHAVALGKLTSAKKAKASRENGKKGGRPPRFGMKTNKPSVEERFWAKVQRGLVNQCWLWMAYLDPKGYGRFGVWGNNEHAAYRWAWTLTKGPIPPGMSVLHTCDNPQCVNPNHLYLGTQADNMRDTATRHRRRVKPKLPRQERRKLSDDQITAIRNDSRQYRYIADDYGISQSMVCLIKSGRRRVLPKAN